MSVVPWKGPIAAVRVGRVEGAWILNPTFQQLEFSDVDLTVSGSRDSIVMVEGGALELTEGEIVKALEVAQRGIRELLDAADELVADTRQRKVEWTKVAPPAPLVARVREVAGARVTEALNLREKAERAQALAALKATVREQLGAEFPDNAKDIGAVLEEIEYTTMREQVLTRSERVDGRDLDTVRPISCEVGVLPRTHGSALFTRGQTQALVSVTLGSLRRRRDGAHQGRSPGRGSHRHPGHRGPARRHGLQGRRHAPGRDLDPDGYQDRGAGLQDHQRSARQGAPRAAAHPGHHGSDDRAAALAALQVRAAHHHDPDPAGQDR